MQFIKPFFLLQVTILLILTSCNNQVETAQKNEENNLVAVKYAKGFQIEDKTDYKVITLKDAWKGGKASYQYVLYKNEPPKGYDKATFIQVPIKKIVCMSATHIALLDKLNRLNTIVAMSGPDYVSNPKVKGLVASNKIKEAGNYQGLNYELLVDEKPDLIMSFGINESSSKQINKLKELELKVVLNAEYMESHPLGKLEWIKFVAAFYDMENEADSIFKNIETEYIELLGLTKNIKNKPTVFAGMPWNGVWQVPGGNSYMAHFFNDAGADYLWSKNKEKASYPKNIEVILDEALGADYWLNLNSYSTMNAITEYDQKYSKFSAFKKNQLYNNDKRLNSNGGNDYFESGPVNPHIVLKDLIEIFHPDILDHELYYYKKMK